MKVDLLSFGNVVWQRFTNVSWLRTYDREKAGTGSIPEGKTCRARIVIAWLNTCKLLECLTVSFFFFLISEFLRLFQKMTCVLSSEHESEIVAIIGTLLDDIHVGCK